ncbi:transcriptional regulator, TetR family [Actinacidiphila alni]|uniref:Transcriptional regulator, TetR family n=1 Tax=Actinacidiphila alni TaxID=380248 RepID=A0A1I2ISX0_9ACTN|nr:TetR/AcrR family transcriptional regulator [Actinacidiphila alni]SFF44810.1 transcriptional regulator, TetR family [Actinacidiphila alni]
MTEPDAKKAAAPKAGTASKAGAAPKRRRADAERNVSALLAAAKKVFDTSGVDAPAKQITDLAGLGVGTLYRHFPLRSDLVKAVVQSNIDACAAAGPRLAAAHEPADALAAWLRAYTELLGTKRGLASALHSGDPAYEALPGYFLDTLTPTLTALLDAGVAAGTVRDDIAAPDLIHAIANLCLAVPGADPDGPYGFAHSRRMVDLLIDGLRTG